jgi:uncharacterized membrane protein YfcA
MSLPEILLFTAIVAGAAVTQAVTGFGFTLLALGALGFWMDVREASLTLAPAGLAVNALLLFRLRTHFSWDGIRPLFLAAVAAVPFGAYLLIHGNLRLLELILALVMFASVVQSFRRAAAANPQPWHPVRAGIPCGLVGGLLSGAFGTAGPPIVLYLLHRPVTRFQFVAVTQAMFGTAAAIRVLHFIAAGQLTARHLPTLVPGILAAVAGVTLGVTLLHRISERTMRHLVLACVAAAGLRYLWAALAG